MVVKEKSERKKKVKKRSTWREKNQVEHGLKKIKRKAGRIWRNVVKKVQVTYRTGKGARTLWEEKKRWMEESLLPIILTCSCIVMECI